MAFAAEREASADIEEAIAKRPIAVGKEPDPPAWNR